MKVLNGLDLRKFKCFANKYLQYRLCFKVEVEEVIVSVKDLDLLDFTLRVRDEDWGRLYSSSYLQCAYRPIDIVVGLQLHLVNLVLVVTQLIYKLSSILSLPQVFSCSASIC